MKQIIHYNLTEAQVLSASKFMSSQEICLIFSNKFISKPISML